MRSRTPSRRRAPRSVLGPIASAIACSLALVLLAPSAASATDPTAPPPPETVAASGEAVDATAASTQTGEADAATAPVEEPATPAAPASAPVPAPAAPQPAAAPAAPAQPAPSGGDAQRTPSQPSTEPVPSEAVEEAPDAVVQQPVALAEEPAAVAPMAVGAPEAAASPYLHWLVSPAAAGSTFELQHRSRTGTALGGETWWADWSAWSASTTVADCTTGCASPGDLDADPGELQVSQAGTVAVVVNTATAQHEYRVRPVLAPAGRFWTDTSWRTASLTAQSADLGTFTTTSNAALSCTAGSVYSLGPSSDDTIRRVPTSPGSFTLPVPNLASGDALGIGAGGTSAYLIERSSNDSSGIDTIRRYSVALGWQTFSNLTGFESKYRYTAGAVNPVDGSYYVAGFGNGNADQAIIYRYTPETGIRMVGTFPSTVPTQKATGDLAFDAAGNLYAVITSEKGATQIFTVTAQSLSAAAGGVLSVANATPPISAAGTVGAAYDADGRLFFGTGSTIQRYNPSTQAFEGATTAIPASTDLASCLTPSSLTVVKDIVGRVGATDQFTVEAVNPNGTVVASAKTEGEATGVQAAQAGPVIALAGASYRITETFSNGNGASYAVGYACVDQNGSPVAVGTGTPGSGTVAIPSGASVTCTIRNAPLTGSVVIRKIVEDADGTTRTPGNGWSVTTGVTATTGTVTPAGSTTKTTVGGSATWPLAFGSAAARATIAVSETQQAGYAFQEGACIVRPIDAAPFAQSFSSAAGTTMAGVAPGARIECSFVNRQQPTRLTLVNQANGADPAAWSLSATPTGGSPIAFTSGVARDVSPASYALAATGGPATHVGGAWSCVDQAGATVEVSGSSVTIAAGKRVTCTILHDTARLVLLKHIDASMAGSLEPGDFQLTATPGDSSLGLAATTVTGAESAAAANTFAVRPGAAYALTEASVYAYLQLQLQRLDGSTWVDVPSNQITAPVAGQTATYRFVNAAPPALALPLTGGIGADAYLLGGLALLVLAATAVAVRIRVVRRERRLA